MPALSNPRHEAFAQAIFAGLTGKTRIDRAQSIKAYPNCSSGNSAEACASRLLRNAKPILDRVREANKRLEPKLDLSRERIGRRLDKASRIAEEQGNASAMATSELGIAKVFHGAQTALFAALSDGHGYSQGKAYRAAGYLAKPGASADSAASSRLRKFKGILDRVRELVAEANARNQHNVDLSRERIGRDLDHAARLAREQETSYQMWYGLAYFAGLLR